MTTPITALGYVFDATQVEPSAGRMALPDGWYNIMFTQGECKPTKDTASLPREQQVWLAELGAKVMDGPYAGQMIYDRLNLWNPNETAARIANGTLSAICHAIGVFQVNDLQQLWGKPLMARVKYKPAKGEYDEGNDVKAYAKTGMHQPGPTGAAAAAAGPGAPGAPPGPGGAATFTPPWSGAGNGQPAAPAPTSAPTPAPPAPPGPPGPPTPVGPPAAPAAGGPGTITPPWAK